MGLKAVANPETGGGGAAGITINTSVITGGTNTRVLFDDNEVIGENGGLTFTKASGLLSSTVLAIGGSTIGANALAVTGTSLFSGAETINLNAASALSPVTGTALHVLGADGVNGRVQSTSFGTIASFTAARANGTGASPTPVVSGNQIGGVNAYSYVTSASPGFVGPVASYQTFATENHTTTSMGSKAVIATTPNGSTTLTTALTVDQDQSATLVGRLTAAGITNTGNGAASVSNSLWNGTVFTGGSGTTTFPAMFVQPSGTTAVTSWSTSGTGLGMNLASGFAGNFLDFHVAGGASLFKIGPDGTTTTGSGASFVSGGNVFASSNGTVGWASGRGTLSSPAAGSIQHGSFDVASGAVAQTLTFQGNTASTTNGPLALIRGAGAGSSTSVGGELRLSGGLSSAPPGTGGAITFYTAPAAAGNVAVLAMTIASTGAVTVAGTLQSKDFRSSKTANYSVLASDTGAQFDNIGASGEVDFTLPTAAVGLKYGFTVKAAQVLKVIAGSSTIIAIGASISASAGNIQANTAYSSVQLEAISTTEWVATSGASGSWTVT